jgi:hypothetical protein
LAASDGKSGAYVSPTCNRARTERLAEDLIQRCRIRLG